jgi:hypothetical protein
MKSFKLLLLVFVCISTYMSAASQNVLVNILTRNAGIVKKGKHVFLEVTINNTNASAFVNVFKVKAQISVPSGIVKIADTGHDLPTGWTIISNDGSTITLSNGKDMIAGSDSRTILIAMEGIKTGGPSTISAQLTFSNGESPGSAPGTLAGDNPADNSSTTTVKVQR